MATTRDFKELILEVERDTGHRQVELRRQFNEHLRGGEGKGEGEATKDMSVPTSVRKLLDRLLNLSVAIEDWNEHDPSTTSTLFSVVMEFDAEDQALLRKFSSREVQGQLQTRIKKLRNAKSYRESWSYFLTGDFDETRERYGKPVAFLIYLFMVGVAIYPAALGINPEISGINPFGPLSYVLPRTGGYYMKRVVGFILFCITYAVVSQPKNTELFAKWLFTLIGSYGIGKTMRWLTRTVSLDADFERKSTLIGRVMKVIGTDPKELSENRRKASIDCGSGHFLNHPLVSLGFELVSPEVFTRMMAAVGIRCANTDPSRTPSKRRSSGSRKKRASSSPRKKRSSPRSKKKRPSSPRKKKRASRSTRR